MSTGTIFTTRGHCDPAYTTFTFDSLEVDKQFNHDATFVAPVVAFQQPLPPAVVYGRDGVTPMVFTPNNGASIPGLIGHITENFIIDTQYPEGQVPDHTTITVETLSAAAIAQINAAFGLSLS
jgi:hypothetical protein